MKNHGPCIYLDKSARGGTRKQHNVYRADITIGGIRYRRRSKKASVLENWLRSMGAKL
jgi:hypothetical protein